MVGNRFPFPCLPTGWYAIALSQELKPGQILSRRYFERDLIAYRLESGEVRVSDAFVGLEAVDSDHFPLVVDLVISEVGEGECAAL